MRRLPCTLLLSVLLIGCAGSAAPTPRSVAVPVAPDQQHPALSPVALPRDDAPHRALTEWWYFTGHLTAGDRPFGFEFVIFQSERRDAPRLYASHFAITDMRTGTFAYAERTALRPHGGDPETLDLAVDTWTLNGGDGRFRIRARMEAHALDVDLVATRPPILHGGTGIISLGPAGDSYYYSYTRLAATGVLAMAEGVLPVSGLVWMDHQWGDFISAGGGWDWFALHLDGGLDATFSRVFDEKGDTTLRYGSLLDDLGRTTHLSAERFRIDSLATWTSPHSGATYPARWRVSVPEEGLDLTIEPVLADQELDTRASTGVTYWEGAVLARGSRWGAPISGQGYVELNGYATTLVGDKRGGAR